MEGRRPGSHTLPWLWKWATLTWAHPGCPRTGRRADTGSNLANRSPPAARRPFLGKERGRGRKEAAPTVLLVLDPAETSCRH